VRGADILAGRAAPGWAMLAAAQREGLEMIATKLAQLLCGDPTFPDHAADIAGYARLLMASSGSKLAGSAPDLG
jgi:hypothetical protein